MVAGDRGGLMFSASDCIGGWFPSGGQLKEEQRSLSILKYFFNPFPSCFLLNKWKLQNLNCFKYDVKKYSLLLKCLQLNENN